MNDLGALRKKVKHEGRKQDFIIAKEAKDASNTVIQMKASFFDFTKAKFIEDLNEHDDIDDIQNAEAAKAAAGKVSAAKSAKGTERNGESGTKAAAVDEEDNSVGTEEVATSYFLQMVGRGTLCPSDCEIEDSNSQRVIGGRMLLRTSLLRLTLPRLLQRIKRVRC